MSNAPFDLARLDYQTVLKNKRRKLLLWSTAPGSIILLVALWLAAPFPLTYMSIKAYERQDFQAARNWIAPLTLVSPEPFTAAFDSGTIDTRLGMYARAESELTRAVAIAPGDKVCMAVENLVASLKAHASTYDGRSKTASQLTAKSKTVMKAHPDCFIGGASQGGGGGSSDAAAANQSPSEAQQQQLLQKEQEGQERQQQYASEEKFDPSDPKLKPW